MNKVKSYASDWSTNTRGPVWGELDSAGLE